CSFRSCALRHMLCRCAGNIDSTLRLQEDRVLACHQAGMQRRIWFADLLQQQTVPSLRARSKCNLDLAQQVNISYILDGLNDHAASRRSTRPGRLPLCLPSFHTTTPLTSTVSIPNDGTT